LDENKVEYSFEEETGIFKLKITKNDYSKIWVFLYTKIKMPLKCVSIPYQTLFIDGEGNYTWTNYSSDVDELASQEFDIAQLPRHDFRKKYLSCTFCPNEAQFILNGNSICREHFIKIRENEEKISKENEAKTKDLEKTIAVFKKTTNDFKDATDELTKSVVKPKPREKEEMYR